MNSQIAILQPLCAALRSPTSANPNQLARRHRIGDFLLEAEALVHFNQLLAKLHHFPLECDQLATASREMMDPSAGHRSATSIEQRLQLASVVSRMLSDASWQPCSDAVEPARMVIDYVGGQHHLMPEGVPLVSHLDEAILIDAAWPQLGGEVDCYLDFCRLRTIEAELSGCEVNGLVFSRDDWQRERRAEADLIADCRRVGAQSYLSSTTSACFHVH